MALLEVKNLGISFGGLRAVDSFDVTVEPGQLYGLKMCIRDRSMIMLKSGEPSS